MKLQDFLKVNFHKEIFNLLLLKIPKINIFCIVKESLKVYNNIVQKILFLITLNKQCQNTVLKD